MNQILLHAHHLAFGYNQSPVLHEVTLSLRSGDLVAVIGPNGSGKTTLLKLLCGILKPLAGEVQWRGHDLHLLRRRDIARQVAFVPQELNLSVQFNVLEMVRLGRTPHIRPLLGESSEDRLAVARALELTETSAFRYRFLSELSGGEQQRVVIAMALAQIGLDSDAACVASRAPSVLLLDEPTVHLDINHQIEVLELIRKLNRESGLTVLATMHDLNLASLYFDRLVLLNDGHVVTQGTPSEVLSKDRVEDVFRTGVVVQRHPTYANIPHIVLLPTNGNGKHPPN